MVYQNGLVSQKAIPVLDHLGVKKESNNISKHSNLYRVTFEYETFYELVIEHDPI